MRYRQGSSASRIMLWIAGGVAVVIGSFWVSLQVMDTWFLPPNASEIRVVEATYGFNCREFGLSAGQEARVKKGNATTSVAQTCGEAKGSCQFKVDVGRLGDPVPGCQKDF